MWSNGEFVAEVPEIDTELSTEDLGKGLKCQGGSSG